MAQWNLTVLDKARGLWPKESNEANLIEMEIEKVTAHLLVLNAKQALSMGDVNTAIVKLNEANRYYKSAKISAATLLLRLASSLIRGLLRLRGMLLPGYK